METKGLRVVRGPDWKWGDQDGGEGCVGTVVAKGGKLDRMLAELAEAAERAGLKPPDIGRRVGSLQSRQSEEGFVFVMWDSGSQADYRTGFKGAHDLRIVDSSLVGVQHTGFFCQWINSKNVPCNKEICGIRWRCTECNENLCTGCFLRSKWLHKQDHTTFDRYDTPNASPVKIQVNLIDRIKLWGIFPNAEVIRGKDWRYGDEDDGAVGKVVTDRSWVPVPGKVRVKWGTKDPILYRRGFDGKVDLVAKKSTIGGQYQREWLPVLNTVLQTRKHEGSCFVVGHRVRINAKVGQEDLRDKQAGSARWDPLMVKEIGKIGTVSRVDHDGDVHVEYKESGKKWCFNPVVLEKVSCYAVGQAVRVRDRGAAYDEMINELGQTGRKLAGKTGSVVDVTVNGRIIIEVDQMQKSKPLKESWVEDVPLVSKLRKLELKLASLLVEASGDGDLSSVKNLITRHSVSADETRNRGVTALHMASRNGHIEIVKYLMKDLGANPDLTDDRGRTAIYFAVKGRQLKVIEFLMNERVQLNLMTNNKKLTPLQKAVAKQSKECVQLLISNATCNVNQADEDGNTPLHNAAYRSRLKINDGRVPEIVKLLIECKEVNQSIRNKKGFNALHAAVSAGDLCVVNYLLANDIYGLGFEKVACTQTTSLHLACASKQYEVGKALVEYFEKKVTEPQPSSSSSLPITFKDLLNAKDNNDHTPLMMACFKGAYGLVELLVNKGADIHSVDKDGDSLIILTALHMRKKTISQKARAALRSIMNQSRFKAKRIPDGAVSPDIFALYAHYMGDGNSNDNPMKIHPALSIVYFLIGRGCSWSASKRKTSKIIDDDSVIVSINTFADSAGQPTVDEDSSDGASSGGIQPDNGVEHGGAEVPGFALRSDVVPVKCYKCPNNLSFLKFVSCGHTYEVCNKCDRICSKCRPQMLNTAAAETTTGGYVKQTVPNVPFMTPQRPSARSTPNSALLRQPDFQDYYNNLINDVFGTEETVVEENRLVNRPMNEDLHTPAPVMNNENFSRSTSSDAVSSGNSKAVTAREQQIPYPENGSELTASFNSTLFNEHAPVHSAYPSYDSFSDRRSEEQVPVPLSRYLAADIQQMPPPHQPSGINFNGHNTCENQSVNSIKIENNNGQQQPITSTFLAAQSAVGQSYGTSTGCQEEGNGFAEITNSVDMSLTTTREEAGAGSAVHNQSILLAAQNASAQIPAPHQFPPFHCPGEQETVPSTHPTADIQQTPAPQQPNLNGHNTCESIHCNEMIDNDNRQQQPSFIVTILAPAPQVEPSYVTSGGLYEESNGLTESTNAVDISLPTTGEEAGTGSAVFSQPILLSAQNASVHIPAPQPAAATIPTALPPTSSKVQKKVIVQVDDDGAAEEWTLIEKGSRKETDLLVGPDGNGYTKNGKRWLCTKAAPPKQEGGKNEKCPAKVQENSKNGSYKVISSIHLHIPENGKRKNHDKQLQKPPSKKQK